ncbi:uncharacterized protein [Montipora foliosa]|uniref:uncharacterized protein n=1 Tax=Montipora foliosa TaxID=591990 RepID=UPI0035F10BD1
MTSTENLLQDCDKYTSDTFEFGYRSGTSDAAVEYSTQQKTDIKNRQNCQINLGLENQGYESDSEHTNTRNEDKGQLRRAASEEKNAVSKPANRAVHKDERRHSYAGPTFSNGTKISDSVIAQDTSSTRRRSSAPGNDLRRKACLNSMRLNSVASHGSQKALNVCYHEDGVEDTTTVNRNEAREKNGRGESFKENREMSNSGAVQYDMGRVCSALESENKKLSVYSKRLSNALQERAHLEEELENLRQGSSVQRLPMHEKWKSVPNIHFRNEKLNSVRRKNRETDNTNLPFEILGQKQTESSRKLPDIPTQSSNDLDRKNQFKEKTQRITESKVGAHSPQRRFDGESTQHSKGKGDQNRFYLSEVEKQRRGEKIADLAADLWKKLQQGEKFHEDVEPKNENISPKADTRHTSKESRASAKRETTKYISNVESPILGGRNTRRGTKVKGNDNHFAEIADDAHFLASRSQESQTSIEERATLKLSESESNIAHATPFKRNERRALRCKRGSKTFESLIARVSPSSSQLRNDKLDDVYREQFLFSNDVSDEGQGPGQEQSHGIEKTRPVKLEFQNSEVASQKHRKWFDYMLPPGNRGTTTRHRNTILSQDAQLSLPENARSSNAAPTLKEKLRFYQELQVTRLTEENSFDITDVYVASQDARDGNELRRQAAGEAAIIRRQASHLLWQAMNLERICDPNARVRHIFTPY